MPQDTAKPGSSLLNRLPRISPVARMILFTGIFLVVAIPLSFTYAQQQARQAELNQRYAILEKALGKPESPEALKSRLAGDIKIARNDVDNSKIDFPSPDRIPEIIDRLLELAKANGLVLTKMQVGAVKNSISVGADILEYPVVAFDINFSGQMPRFQNFLLALNGKFPTAEVKSLSFGITEIEEKEDTGNMVLNIYSNRLTERSGGEIAIAGKKPLATFADKKDMATAPFKIKGVKWRIDWNYKAADPDWAGLTLAVYRKGETMRYADVFYHAGGSLEGTDYVYYGEGDYYLRIITGNVASWDIKVYE
jgi:hypothetical protein